MKKEHPFTTSGNGKAPFQLIGFQEKRRSAKDSGILVFGGPGQPTGVCEHCGTGIALCFKIRSADGNEFFVGSTCVEKTNDSTLISEVRNYRKNAVVKAQLIENKLRAEKFLSSNPGLAEALNIDHHISRDLLSNLIHWGSMSEKQIALAFKLSKQVAQRASDDAVAIDVPAIDGRQTIEGVIVSTKVVDTQFGSTIKMLVKVITKNGIYKVFGTCPNVICLVDTEEGQENPSGYRIRFDAKLQPKERGFGFFSRPTKITLLGKEAS